MRIVTYEFNGEIYSGVIKSNFVVPFAEFFGENVTTLEFINSAKDDIIDTINKKIKDIENICSKVNAENVKLLSPIHIPFRNVFCLGKNYHDHIKELAGFTGTGEVPTHPVYFTKTAYPPVGPCDNINLNQDATKCLDYEVELGIIVGKKGRNIKKEEAYSYIFGYTIINDVSAREVQKNHSQWFKGKSLDGTCPIGPHIVTKDEIADVNNLNIKSTVNGELRQNSNTKNMIFDIPFIISQLSQGLTLYPGDIIATGTPSGVGQGFDPPKYLKKGDIVNCEIESIGNLVNVVS